MIAQTLKNYIKENRIIANVIGFMFFIGYIVFYTDNDSYLSVIPFLFYTIIFLGICSASGRLSFAMFSTSIIMFLIYHTSKIKHEYIARNLSALDFYNYFNLDMLIYATKLYPSYKYYIIFSVLLIVVLFLLLFYFSKKDINRINFLGATLSVVMSLFIYDACLGYIRKSDHLVAGNNPDEYWIKDRHHLASLAYSSLDTIKILYRGSFFEFKDISLENLKEQTLMRSQCAPHAKQNQTDIIIVLRESTMVPSEIRPELSKKLGYAQFSSDDKKYTSLKVETHGGGSSLSIFNLLTGLSVEPLKELKYLVNDFVPGKFDDSIARYFLNCGYETIVITTGDEKYSASKTFYEGLGFKNYASGDDIMSFRERNNQTDDRNAVLADRTIYEFVKFKLDQVKKKKSTPVFVFVDTVASHSPYDKPYDPDKKFDDLDFIVEPTVKEYIRRVAIAENELAEFKKTLKDTYKNTSNALVVDFGDHQPFFTKNPFLVKKNNTAISNENNALQKDELFNTYVRWHSVNGQRKGLEGFPERTDIMFLGDHILKMIGHKPDGFYAYRRKFIEDCGSSYWKCEDGAYAHKMHALMRKSGMLRF